MITVEGFGYMRLIVEREEFKQAFSALAAIAKKAGTAATPSSGQPTVAMVLDADGTYKMVTCSEELSITAPLNSVTVVGGTPDVAGSDTEGGSAGSDASMLRPYSGRPPLTSASTIGIVETDKMLALVKKLPKGEGTVDLEYAPVSSSSSTMQLTVRCGKGEYVFACREPSRICSLFGTLPSGMVEVASMTPDDMDRLVSEAAFIGGMLPASLSRPEFGCVCLSSEDRNGDGSHTLRVSGTSSAEGYSTMLDMGVDVSSPFEALIAAKTATALKGLVSQFSAEGWTSMSVDGERAAEGKPMTATRLRLSNDAYTVWVRCTGYAFPFSSLRALTSSMADPIAAINVPYRGFSDMLGRVALLKAMDPPVTGIALYDGGVVQLSEAGAGGISRPVGKEQMDVPDGNPSFKVPGPQGIAVDTDVLVRILKAYAGNKEIRISMTSGRGAKLAITSEGVSGETMTSILLERR